MHKASTPGTCCTECGISTSDVIDITPRCPTCEIPTSYVNKRMAKCSKCTQPINENDLEGNFCSIECEKEFMENPSCPRDS